MKPAPILVTGASSGIGNHLVRYLAERGHTIFATAREDSDLKALGLLANVIPLRMDVRDTVQINNALQQVTNAGLGLYGLVNNAGIGELGMFSTWTDEEMLNIFNVNVFGPHRVTNAFLSMLVESRGRIVNIGSQGGMISSKYYGPYTMTKHALEAYTVALSDELRPYSVWVSIVQPGGILTDIGRNSIPGTLARFNRAKPPFQEEGHQVLASFSQTDEPDPNKPESASNRKPSSPEIVSTAVYDALFSPHPKLRYLVGTRWEGDRVLNALIEQLLDENDNPQHRYSRNELITMLDHHLAQRSQPN